MAHEVSYRHLQGVGRNSGLGGIRKAYEFRVLGIHGFVTDRPKISGLGKDLRGGVAQGDLDMPETTVGRVRWRSVGERVRCRAQCLRISDLAIHIVTVVEELSSCFLHKIPRLIASANGSLLPIAAFSLLYLRGGA
jgi:hypothetical protein